MGTYWGGHCLADTSRTRWIQGSRLEPRKEQSSNKAAFIVRIGLWGILYYISRIRDPQNSIGNYLRPCSTQLRAKPRKATTIHTLAVNRTMTLTQFRKKQSGLPYRCHGNNSESATLNARPVNSVRGRQVKVAWLAAAEHSRLVFGVVTNYWYSSGTPESPPGECDHHHLR